MLRATWAFCVCFVVAGCVDKENIQISLISLEASQASFSDGYRGGSRPVATMRLSVQNAGSVEIVPDDESLVAWARLCQSETHNEIVYDLQFQEELSRIPPGATTEASVTIRNLPFTLPNDGYPQEIDRGVDPMVADQCLRLEGAFSTSNEVRFSLRAFR